MLNSINIAQTGLKASQKVIDTINNNIANNNTEGYKNRVSSLSEISSINQIGQGVFFENVNRITNIYFEKNITDKNTTVEKYSKDADILNSINNIFTETENYGLSSLTQNFYNQLENLRMYPDNNIYKEALYSSMNNFANEINNASNELNNLEKSVVKELEAQISEANKITKEIASLNQELKNNPTNELLDKRDLLEQKLSTYMNITVEKDSLNAYSIKVGDKNIVFNNTSHDLTLSEYTSPQNISFSKNNNSTLLGENTFETGSQLSISIDNNVFSINYGESFEYDLNGDGVKEIGNVDETNYIRVMVAKINESKLSIEAKNGLETSSLNQDNFLVLTNPNYNSNINIYYQNNTNKEQISLDNFSIKNYGKTTNVNIYDSDITIDSGSMKSLLNNSNLVSNNNYILENKQKLEDLKNNLIELTSMYSLNSDNTYNYGMSENINGTYNQINLFQLDNNGNLLTNKSAINNLSNEDLNYLTRLQWDKPEKISGVVENIRTTIVSELEDTNNYLETSTSILETLKSNYSELTKVDIDEQMLNLMKFQASYQANAKIVSAYDEMIKTLLNM